ncbi:hypothetical protein DKX38_020459 [Salix brachista]|uniref:40S ribosomal protein S29 n=1 Tax=Salix brachista TaxID=2182728 RepID=A0A5N5K602_9ROSI|nr:hypothetical protein DKX38_020459 [Salix brachista]
MLTTAISEQYLLICMDNLFNIHGKLKESEHGLILGSGLQMLDMFPRLSCYRRMQQRLYPLCCHLVAMWTKSLSSVNFTFINCIWLGILIWNIVVGSRVCGNPHGIIRKYGLMCCRQCFRSNAKEIGFIKVRRQIFVNPVIFIFAFVVVGLYSLMVAV